MVLLYQIPVILLWLTISFSGMTFDLTYLEENKINVFDLT
jgi:hypothetical protein